MSEFVATHESIGGVKVRATDQGDGYQKVQTDDSGQSALFNDREFALLFKPIPKPVIVTLTIDDASQLLTCLQGMNIAGRSLTALQDAIAEAEAEAKT